MQVLTNVLLYLSEKMDDRNVAATNANRKCNAINQMVTLLMTLNDLQRLCELLWKHSRS